MEGSGRSWRSGGGQAGVPEVEEEHDADLVALAPYLVDEGVISMKPFHECPPTTLWHTLVSPDRWDTAFPWKSLSDLGTPPVFGSDWPIVSCAISAGKVVYEATVPAARD